MANAVLDIINKFMQGLAAEDGELPKEYKGDPSLNREGSQFIGFDSPAMFLVAKFAELHGRTEFSTPEAGDSKSDVDCLNHLASLTYDRQMTKFINDCPIVGSKKIQEQWAATKKDLLDFISSDEKPINYLFNCCFGSGDELTPKRVLDILHWFDPSFATGEARKYISDEQAELLLDSPLSQKPDGTQPTLQEIKQGAKLFTFLATLDSDMADEMLGSPDTIGEEIIKHSMPFGMLIADGIPGKGGAGQFPARFVSMLEEFLKAAEASEPGEAGEAVKPAPEMAAPAAEPAPAEEPVAEEPVEEPVEEPATDIPAEEQPETDEIRVEDGDIIVPEPERAPELDEVSKNQIISNSIRKFLAESEQDVDPSQLDTMVRKYGRFVIIPPTTTPGTAVELPNAVKQAIARELGFGPTEEIEPETETDTVEEHESHESPAPEKSPETAFTPEQLAQIEQIVGKLADSGNEVDMEEILRILNERRDTPLVHDIVNSVETNPAAASAGISYLANQYGSGSSGTKPQQPMPPKGKIVMPVNFKLDTAPGMWNRAVITELGFPFINFTCPSIAELLHGNDPKRIKAAYKRVKGMFKSCGLKKPIATLKEFARSSYRNCTANGVVVEANELLHAMPGTRVQCSIVDPYSKTYRTKGSASIPYEFLTAFYTVMSPVTALKTYADLAGTTPEALREVLANTGMPPIYVLSPKRVVFRRGPKGGILHQLFSSKVAPVLVRAKITGHDGGFLIPERVADTIFTE